MRGNRPWKINANRVQRQIQDHASMFFVGYLAVTEVELYPMVVVEG